MMITITPLHLFHLVVVASIIWLVWTTVKLNRVTWELEQFKKGLIAHAKLLPTPPTPQLIAQWRHQYETLPEDAPKRQAYKNRLIEVGVLDDNGNDVKVEEASGD